MNILIVAEKPSVSRAIAPTARQHWPAANIVFVHAVPYGNFKFAYPRGLKMADYPNLSEPVNRLSTWDTWSCAPLVMSADGALATTTMGPEFFTAADVIVYACDPDHTGAVSFDVLLREVFGDNRAAHCPALQLSDLHETLVKKAFANIRPFIEACEQNLEYGRVKRYFDWNWNVNGLAILGETLRRAGVPADTAPLSKYSLQVLYALRNAEPSTEGEVVHLMYRWPGTGRYKRTASAWFPGVGSLASRGQILDNLLLAGLLERVAGPKQELLQLTALAHTLLAQMHPDCEDPDLPFRLHAWCEQGAAAKPAIDRYLNTFFGKQKRFLTRDVRG
jgi:hypothetical protein